jgi:phosphoglycolate phosphatase
MLAELGYAKVGEEKVRNWIGNGADKLLERALHNALQSKPDELLTSKASQLFTQAYANNIANLTTCYPGCHEVLKYFQVLEIPLACVTNKPRQFTLPSLDALGLSAYFDVVVCGDDLATKKPDPAPLLFALDQLQGQPQHGYMIGDSVTDILTAKNAGTGAIYVSYGYNRGVSVEQYAPIAVNRLEQLLSLFSTKSDLDVSSSM